MAPRRWPEGAEPLPCSVIFLAALLFVAAEIVAFVAVAGQIGFVLALVLLVAASALGPFVVRRVGVGIIAHTRKRLLQGEVPTKELLDGLVVLVGGVLICVPGFIGDALGLVLMVGPVRHLLIRVSGHRIARRVQRPGSSRWQVINVESQPSHHDRRSGMPLPPGIGPPPGVVPPHGIAPPPGVVPPSRPPSGAGDEEPDLS